MVFKGALGSKREAGVRMLFFAQNSPLPLFRHGPLGAKNPGLIDASGGLRDWTGLVADIAPATLGANLDIYALSVWLTGIAAAEACAWACC